MSEVTGILLAQLGTPASPAVPDVRRYLREFLSDPRVIDLPAPARWLLVNGIIAPFRAPKSAHAYQSIWTPQGSPLLVNSRAFAEALQRELGAGSRVALGMRYSAPRLDGALGELCDAGVSRIVAFRSIRRSRSLRRHRDRRDPRGGGEAPELPAHLVCGAVLRRRRLHRRRRERGARGARPRALRPRAVQLPRPARAPRARGRPVARALPRERGLLRRAARGGARELLSGAVLRDDARRRSRARAAERGVTSSFQSRLGRDPWIKPWTDEELPRLAARGVKRLAVLCPSFVADCLETLEEVGIRAREQWLGLGGEALALVPCLNASPAWVSAAAELVRRS
jgi:ferrochelatase